MVLYELYEERYSFERMALRGLPAETRLTAYRRCETSLVEQGVLPSKSNLGNFCE